MKVTRKRGGRTRPLGWKIDPSPFYLPFEIPCALKLTTATHNEVISPTFMTNAAGCNTELYVGGHTPRGATRGTLQDAWSLPP